MSAHPSSPHGAVYGDDALVTALQRVREPLHVVQAASGHVGVAVGTTPPGAQLLGSLPPLYPEWLGDRGFCEAHGTRFPYVSGAMANGIATTRLVIAMGQSGCMGFFGAAGLSLPRIQAAVAELREALGDRAP